MLKLKTNTRFVILKQNVWSDDHDHLLAFVSINISHLTCLSVAVHISELLQPQVLLPHEIEAMEKEKQKSKLEKMQEQLKVHLFVCLFVVCEFVFCLLFCDVL